MKSFMFFAFLWKSDKGMIDIMRKIGSLNTFLGLMDKKMPEKFGV